MTEDSLAAPKDKSRSKIVITKPVSELIRSNPDLLLYDGKQIKIPSLGIAEDASSRPPSKFALALEEQGDGTWLVTGIEPLE